MHTPSRARRAALALSAAAAALVSLLAVPAVTAATATDAAGVATISARPAADAKDKLRDRADRLFLKTSLAEFNRIAAKKSKPAADAKDPLDWSNNGCSSVTDLDPYKAIFRRACIRHDFGYRNFGNGLALRSYEEAKAAIDKQFLKDMNTICNGRLYDGNCRSASGVYFGLLRQVGSESYTAFYGGECQGGYICLFDDDGYDDRRLRFLYTREKFPDFQKTANLPESTKDFGDKTSSVINNTLADFILFENDHYKGASICVPAGTRIDNLADRDFGDKASSIKRVTDC